ncbi:glutaredoxin family protein [Croceicoccus sp. Ery15]|uniref:glutaredoxin family protein n=1 Tax=Croceicoccus sp. Ery15 TaxID=1703338 RepID=UPI001E4A0170|nr:glutaredoxin family protein [Croceicoccus sp. Ery15]
MNAPVTRQTADQASSKTARLYRMVMPGHICPYGLKSKDLLERKGYRVEDHHLTTRDQTDAFKARHDVKTTPQTFIGDDRIGGYDDLRRFFGKSVTSDKDTSYWPVLMIFGMGLAMACAAALVAFGTLLTAHTLRWFVAFTMCLLALQKLKDVESFSTMFLNYDLLARRFVPYAKIYPWAEGLAGVLMIAGIMTWLSAPLALFIGTIGAASVVQAVYIDRRELKCACVGGNSNVPLGFVSLTENVAMMGMGLWMGANWMGVRAVLA